MQFDQLRRRQFVTLLGGAAAAWPLAAWAQQPAKPKVGFLCPASPDAIADRLRGFRQGLKTSGMSRARTSRSNTTGRTVNSIGYRPWRPNWFADRLR